MRKSAQLTVHPKNTVPILHWTRRQFPVLDIRLSGEMDPQRYKMCLTTTSHGSIWSNNDTTKCVGQEDHVGPSSLEPCNVPTHLIHTRSHRVRNTNWTSWHHFVCLCLFNARPENDDKCSWTCRALQTTHTTQMQITDTSNQNTLEHKKNYCTLTHCNPRHIGVLSEKTELPSKLTMGKDVSSLDQKKITMKNLEIHFARKN